MLENAVLESLIVIGLTPMTLGVALLFAWWRYSDHLKQRQQQGVRRILLLKELLVRMQQHRGLSYGALHGDNAMQQRIRSLEMTLSETLKLLQPLQGIPYTRDHWNAFISHWERLQVKNLTLTPENNLAQHNSLIKVVLYLIENVAECSDLTRINLSPEFNVSELWKDILPSAEWVGQARAMGAGVLAAGHCGSVERIRLEFIKSRIAAGLLIRQDASDDTLQPLRGLIQVIDTQIISADGPTISPRDYFDIASQAIDKILQQFEIRMQRLSSHLEMPVT